MSYEDFARRFVHPEDAQRIGDHIQLELDSSEADFVVETEMRTLSIDGSMRWMRIRFKSLLDEQGRKYKLTGVSQDITEKKRSEETIWQQANFDPLTGLPNRRMFQDRLEHEIKKSHRDGLPLALMFIDLDKFKEVNDTLGHDKGDILLIEAARRIATLRARIGYRRPPGRGRVHRHPVRTGRYQQRRAYRAGHHRRAGCTVPAGRGERFRFRQHRHHALSQ